MRRMSIETVGRTAEAPPQSAMRRRLILALRVAFPVVVLGLLWSLVDGPAVLRTLRSADPVWLLAALVMAHLQIILSAVRWRLTARELDQDIEVRRAIGEYYLSQLLNLTLPSGILGDAGRAMRMRHQAGVMRSSQAVLIERMAGQIALFGVMFAGFAIVPWFPDQMAMPPWVRQMVLWIGGVILGMIVVFAMMHSVPGPLRRLADGFRIATLRSLLARGIWPWQVVLSLSTVACNLATVAFAARATGTALPLIAVVTLVPLMLTAMLLPISAGGWGLREGAAAALWPLAGGTAAAGVAGSIAFGLVIMVASLPGIIVLLAPRQATLLRAENVSVPAQQALGRDL